MAIDLTCKIGEQEIHKFEDLIEEQAYALGTSLVEFSGNSITWTHPSPDLWEGTGGRTMTITGLP